MLVAQAPTADGFFNSNISSSQTGVAEVYLDNPGVMVASAETSGGLGPPIEYAEASASLTLAPHGMSYVVNAVLTAGENDPPVQSTVFAGAFARVTFLTDVIAQSSRPLTDLRVGLSGPRPIGNRYFAGTYSVSAGASLSQSGPGSQSLSDAGSLGFVPSSCRPDVDGNIGLSVNDLFAFVAAFFGPGGADYNRSGTTTVQDLFDFLAGYFAGCA
jgi:hypothetical protein